MGYTLPEFGASGAPSGFFGRRIAVRHAGGRFAVRVKAAWSAARHIAEAGLALARLCVSSCPALMASLTGASIVSVSSRMVRLASPSSSVEAPDLIPFLPLAVMVSAPVPQSVTWEPSLHLRTAFSAFSFVGYMSSLFCSLSESILTVPAAASIVTCEDLPQVMDAVSALVSVRPYHARRAIFDLDGAVGTASGQAVDAALGDGQCRPVRLTAAAGNRNGFARKLHDCLRAFRYRGSSFFLCGRRFIRPRGSFRLRRSRAGTQPAHKAQGQKQQKHTMFHHTHHVLSAVSIQSVPRVYLKTPNAPGQRVFSRCAAPFFLEIRQYSCGKMSCSAQKLLAAGHIGSFQIHPTFPADSKKATGRRSFPTMAWIFVFRPPRVLPMLLDV